MSIKSWLRDWLLRDNEDVRNSIVEDRHGHDDFDDHRSMRFSVQPARGGIIVSVRQYDRQRDENTNTVHVIHDDDEVAEKISQIVSMELLRSN